MLSYGTTVDVLEILAQNREFNAPLLNVVERNCHENVRILGDSVRIRDRISGTYMFSAACWNELELLMEEVEKELDVYLVNTSRFNEEILQKAPEAHIDEYVCYIMEKKDYTFNHNLVDGIEVVPLDMGWKNFILEHYKNKEFGNDNYVRNRIQYGLGLGVLYKGRKAAFIMQHKDGETGPLVVDMKFRGKGIGTFLLRYFCQLLFERNSIIYGLVLPSNLPSNRMTISSDYRRAKQNVIWVYRKKIFV